MPTLSIDDHSRERSQDQRGNLTTEAHEPEEKCRSSQTIHEPARRDARDPRADERQALPAEEEAVISMSKCAKRPWHSALLPTSFALFAARSPQHAARFSPGVFSALDRHHAIYQHPIDPAREIHRPLVRRTILQGIEI